MFSLLSLLCFWLGYEDTDITSCDASFTCDTSGDVLGEIVEEEGMVHFNDSLNLLYISFRQFPAQQIGLTCNLPDNLKGDRRQGYL